MKKTLKLAGIFLLAAGLMFLIMNMGSLFSGGTGDPGPTGYGIDITEQRAQIQDAWEQEKKWNEKLYKHFRSEIDQQHAMGMYAEDEDFNAVNNALCEHAVNAACRGFEHALKAGKPYGNNEVKAQYNGITLLSKTYKMANDTRISKASDIHALYVNIGNFCNSRHTIKPDFDGDNWASFPESRHYILDQAASYRNHRYYAYVKDVAGFREGLDEEHLKSAINSHRETFYKGLVEDIKTYYSDRDANADNVNRLNSVYERLKKELNGDCPSILHDLATFSYRYPDTYNESSE